MSHHNTRTAPLSEPRRPLRADFTARIVRHAITAKRRAVSKQQLLTFLKEPLSMKSVTFLRTAPGAVLALAIIATGTTGAYALNNWFNGDVTVKQTASVFSVDLSQCKGSLPPGVDSPDRSHVQFKILDDPHISADQLQHQLLAECEYDAVVDFYRQNHATAAADTHIGTIKSIDGSTVTFDYPWGGQLNQKSLALTAGTTFYRQGNAVSAQDLHAGDHVVFVTASPGYVQEGTDPLAGASEVMSVFKTQSDPADAPDSTKKGFYDDNHIMPLDLYNQIHK
ncbi:MAG TPA: hypothetical protein VMT30_05435 [Candidatus Saccharimonadia bacterium]|nr:hypothetical protein [Candidatus Saccharimonadia bacterium]